MYEERKKQSQSLDGARCVASSDSIKFVDTLDKHCRVWYITDESPNRELSRTFSNEEDKHGHPRKH